ncbi:MAG: PAS domain-containing sensor histidine kinase, partial [Rufibacter sp.]
QTPAIQALVLNSRDVTERVRNREQLQHSERRFRALFENNPDMVLIENQEGEILEANPAFIKVVKLTNEQLVGKKITDFLPAEAAQNCAQELEKAFQGEQVAFEIDASFEGFGRRVLHITKIPVIVQQHVTAVYSVIKDVTEASLAQKTIQEQVEKVRHVFESITDAFFAVDRNWNFTIINGMFEQMMNVDRRDNIGKNLWDAFPQKKSGIFHQQYSHAFDTGTTVQFEAFLKELGIWVEVKAFPSEEGLSVYLSNVTEKVEAKQELEKLSLVASRTINGVIITDAAGKIEWVNNGFSKLTGYTLKEVQGQKTFDLLFGPETNPQVVQLMALKLKQAIPVSEELLHYKKNGEKVWLAIDVTPVTENGSRVSKYIYIQTDVTLRKEMEASQQAMTEDLFQRNRDLQQFTYIVSHNLRAPVANALGLADLLTKIDRQSELFDLSLANLKKSVFKLDTILRDLNLVLSIRDKREIVEKEEVGVADVWEQAYQNFQELLINCGGQVQVEIEPGLTVKANRAYLFSIFYNLLSNAIKYRAEDRPLLIRITAGQFPDTGKQVVFSDNGSGFDQEKAGDQVFKLYKRFHVNKKGRGIGLFLVKTQVEALGGEISVESQVGKGTRFQINLK